MIKWTGLAPWDFDFPFPGSLTFTFLKVLSPMENPRESVLCGKPTGPDPLCHPDDFSGPASRHGTARADFLY